MRVSYLTILLELLKILDSFFSTWVFLVQNFYRWLFLISNWYFDVLIIVSNCNTLIWNKSWCCVFHFSRRTNLFVDIINRYSSLSQSIFSILQILQFFSQEAIVDCAVGLLVRFTLSEATYSWGSFNIIKEYFLLIKRLVYRSCKWSFLFYFLLALLVIKKYSVLFWSSRNTFVELFNLLKLLFKFFTLQQSSLVFIAFLKNS